MKTFVNGAFKVTIVVTAVVLAIGYVYSDVDPKFKALRAAP